MILAAIAIPNLLSARLAAQEASGSETVHAVQVASFNYLAQYQNGFPASMSVLGGTPGAAPTCGASNAIDDTLATSGQKGLYAISYYVGTTTATPAPGCTAAASSTNFAVTAIPTSGAGTNGIVSYCSDEKGLFSDGGAGGMTASQTDAACEGFTPLQ